MEIQHFSHHHPLVFIQDHSVASKAALCLGCDKPPSQHYCDLCEKEREPNRWFYYCADCDNSLHLNCAVGDLPYVKLGSKMNNYSHKHPFTVVKTIWNCPPCKGSPVNHLNDIPLKLKKQRRHNMRDVLCCVEGCSRFGKNG
ncbi:hypothetical protein GOBAR_DD04615 [Gossypium barbadense]|nr:hypothetical protein GOBAR_DD04615 [Gossypium barbadense]